MSLQPKKQQLPKNDTLGRRRAHEAILLKTDDLIAVLRIHGTDPQAVGEAIQAIESAVGQVRAGI